ncbi:MAG: hypothetical protein H8E44_31905, partial [Planctomycetes bacterium]|nr:hypothetical protein [Planctomycetota bacterium]
MTDEQSLSNADGLSEDALMLCVGEVAEQLNRDFQQAQELTDGWRDTDLTYRLVQTAERECRDRLAEKGCWGEADRAPSRVPRPTA